jgi:hypothetical protein
MSDRIVLRRVTRVSVLAAACLLMAVLLRSAPAVAVELKPFGIKEFSIQTTVAREVPEHFPSEHEPEHKGFNVVNEPTTFSQAGGHPDSLTTRIAFDSEPIISGTLHRELPTQDPRDAVVNLPAGLIGNPMAVPRCPLTLVTSKNTGCPSDTQVGLVKIRLYGGSDTISPIYKRPGAADGAPSAHGAGGVGLRDAGRVLWHHGRDERDPDDRAARSGSHVLGCSSGITV